MLPARLRPRIRRLLASSSSSSSSCSILFGGGAGPWRVEGRHHLQCSSPTRTLQSFSTFTRNTPPVSTMSVHSMEGLWKTSTERFLDKSATPLGSLTSLQWHLAETLLLYWSQTNNLETTTTIRTHHKRQKDSESTNSEDETIQGYRFALGLLDRLAEEKRYVGEDDIRTIDVSLVHAFLKQWKACQLLRHQQHQHHDVLLPSQLLETLDRWTHQGLCEPNIATYSILMDGAAAVQNSHRGAGFCKTLFERLLKDSETRPELAPTMVTIGILLQALANTRTKASAIEAEAWLKQIPDLLGEPPNTVVYTTVIRAWAGVGRADKAEDLLREMCQHYYDDEQRTAAAKPNSWTFNTVLAAWSRSKDPGAVQKAESLLKTMKSLTASTTMDVSPTIVSYNSLLSTIAGRRRSNHDSLARAESWMEEILLKATTDGSLAPNLITYKALFNIIGNTSHLSDSEKADRMKYWLARGAARSGSGGDDLQEHPALLEQIRVLEEKSHT